MQPDVVPMLLPPAAFTRSMPSIAAREAQIQTVPERGERGKRSFSCRRPLPLPLRSEVFYRECSWGMMTPLTPVYDIFKYAT